MDTQLAHTAAKGGTLAYPEIQRIRSNLVLDFSHYVFGDDHAPWEGAWRDNYTALSNNNPPQKWGRGIFKHDPKASEQDHPQRIKQTPKP